MLSSVYNLVVLRVTVDGVAMVLGVPGGCGNTSDMIGAEIDTEMSTSQFSKYIFEFMKPFKNNNTVVVQDRSKIAYSDTTIFVRGLISLDTEIARHVV